MTNYHEIRDLQPQMVDCFFAFSKQQLQEGINLHDLKDKKIYSADAGLYGTKQGIETFLNFYNLQHTEISQKCDPQEVYNYEFANHECSYTNTDEEAILLVIGYFGVERAKQVIRKNGFYKF